MTNDKRAETLKAILRGEQLQVKQGGENICRHGAHDAWGDISSNYALVLIGQNCTHTEFRVKPKTLSIEGKKFPEPLKSLLFGQRYYTLDCATVEEFIYEGGRQDCAALKAGLAFATEEDCEAFLSAIQSVLRP